MSAISARVLRRLDGPDGLLAPGTHIEDVSGWRNWRALARTGYLRITGGDSPDVDGLAREGYAVPLRHVVPMDMAIVTAGLEEEIVSGIESGAEPVEPDAPEAPRERPKQAPILGGKRR